LSSFGLFVILCRIRPEPYTAVMSAMREELHLLVDQLPEDRVPPVLALVRENMSLSRRREKALVALERIRGRMRGVTGVDEELDRLREESRG
jgi:hypothetical protein